MKNPVLILLLLVIGASGCTTKSKARADARAAFYQGQAQALASQPGGRIPPQAPPNTVGIIGPVQVTGLIWTHDLTLLKTIIAAEYIPDGTPSRITIFRSGQPIPVSAESLLNGRDIPLLPRDVVELQP